jgi:site-specific DNA recombinase
MVVRADHKPIGPELRWALYARISRDIQGEALGVKRQIEDGLEAIERKGGSIDPRPVEDGGDIFIDNDLSASKFARKPRANYPKLLAAIEDGTYNGVMMAVEDRTHRQVLELAEFVDICRKHNVRVATVGTDYDLDDPDQLSVWFIKVRFAEAEVERTSKRLRRQRRQAAESGWRNYGGKRAFGFVGSGKQQVPLHRALAEQELIREALDRIIVGDSLRGICIDWDTRNIRTALGKRWTNTTLRRMLISPNIAGYRELPDGKLVAAKERVNGQWVPVAPIVDRDKWQTCRTILTDPARRTTDAGGTVRHLLIGSIYCGVPDCGQRLRCRTSGVGKKHVPYRHYYCPNQRGQGGWHVVRAADALEAMIEESFFVAVESRDYSDVAADLAPEDPAKPHYDRLAELGALKDATGKRLREAEARQDAGLSAKSGRSVADYERDLAQYEAEEESCWTAIGRLKVNRVQAYIPGNVRELWPSYSLDRKRAILAAIIERIDVDPQRHGKTFDPACVRLKVRDWQ